jgi:hypothetical protein
MPTSPQVGFFYGLISRPSIAFRMRVGCAWAPTGPVTIRSIPVGKKRRTANAVRAGQQPLGLALVETRGELQARQSAAATG